MEKKKRKPYKKPEIFRIKLLPQDAVLTNCKTSTGITGQGGPGNKCIGVCNKTFGT